VTTKKQNTLKVHAQSQMSNTGLWWLCGFLTPLMLPPILLVYTLSSETSCLISLTRTNSDVSSIPADMEYLFAQDTKTWHIHALW
jgi:hypothetical protein